MQLLRLRRCRDHLLVQEGSLNDEVTTRQQTQDPFDSKDILQIFLQVQLAFSPPLFSLASDLHASPHSLLPSMSGLEL